jgi:thiazole/oxazole-forming peptide maturase SagD family component
MDTLSIDVHSTARCSTGIRAQTDTLLRRMLSPLVGLSTQIGYTLRARGDSRFMMAGAEMTGVHVLRRQPRPQRGHYHIGGAGVHVDEAIIRSLGETVERYTQFTSEIHLARGLRWTTHDALRREGEPVLAPEAMAIYSTRQYAIKGFPFRPFDAHAPMSWIRCASAIGGLATWIPAQLVLVGYNVRTEAHEPRIGLAVTTGGAAHITDELAVRNGLLEQIQIDSAMTHWYSGRPAVRLVLDARVQALESVIHRLFSSRGERTVSFYWLVDRAFPVFSIACVIGDAHGIPAHAVGLGADLGLEVAMYKALLEALGIVQLAKVTLMNLAVTKPGSPLSKINPDAIFDLDTNVGYYALPGHAAALREKFDDRASQPTATLPGDGPTDPADAVALLLQRFQALGLDLFGLDLTTPDARALGFKSHRVWSPQLLSLCMPSAPPAAHPRFATFTGFRYVGPHPYP